LSEDGSGWVASGTRFFVHVRLLRSVFRGKLLSKLERALATEAIVFHTGAGKLLLRKAARVGWVVYAKAPLAGPEQVIRYISRYTQRIAISNSRIVEYDGQSVSFRWRDRANGNRTSKLRIPATDFARRFMQHVLPRRFVRIRHYGLLSNRGRQSLERCNAGHDVPSTPRPRQEAQAAKEDWVVAFKRIFGADPLVCPECGRGRMALGVPLPPCSRVTPPATAAPRAPP
jgi:hypothetical protein